MASLLGHSAVAIAAVRLAHRPASDRRRWYRLALLCSIVADFDVVFFLFGVSYDSFWGHRGFTHSIVFAAMMGAAAAAIAGWRMRTALFFFALAVTHPLLDALTNGGLGVALFSPFDDGRFFLPFQPIEVSPLGIHGFISKRGLEVLASEVPVIFVPCALAIAIDAFLRRRRA